MKQPKTKSKRDSNQNPFFFRDPIDAEADATATITAAAVAICLHLLTRKPIIHNVCHITFNTGAKKKPYGIQGDPTFKQEK